MDGIIFDIDGTLWDSTDSVAASWNRAIRENTSLDLTLDAGILSGLFGKTMTEIGRALFPDDPEEEQARILDICFRYENDYLRDHPGVVYDGVADTIRKLYEKYPLFIVSNCQLGYIEVTMKAWIWKSNGGNLLPSSALPVLENPPCSTCWGDWTYPQREASGWEIQSFPG